ncbi:hypothetical protein OG389_01145 [Streptomyces sp. NBC_00435]|uniref:hypothetical protein n=1 Tax=Streptomyces sp. NBC_00435 TaxID=2903649 RepID=UPI002E1CBBE0
MPDIGKVLGAIGRGALAVGRLVWESVSAPTEADEQDASWEISRLADLIGDTVPEELRRRAWGLVVDGLRSVDADIEQMVEEAAEEAAEKEEEEWRLREACGGNGDGKPTD